MASTEGRYRRGLAGLLLAAGLVSIPSSGFADVAFGYRKKVVSLDIYGEIKPFDVELFSSLLMKFPDAKRVNLDTDGGSLNAAMQIGYTIRAHGMTTVVTGRCASACLYVLMAGTARLAEQKAQLAAHTPRVGDDIARSKSDVFALAFQVHRNVEHYVWSMGFRDNLVRILIDGNRSDPWVIDRNRARELGLLTR